LHRSGRRVNMNDEHDAEQQHLELEMIEHYLGFDSPEKRQRFRTLLERDNDLHRRYIELADALGKLDEYKVLTPNDLAERTMTAVRPRVAVVGPGRTAVTGDKQARSWVMPTGLKELLPAAATVIIMVSAWVVTAGHARDLSRKVLCASNLASLGTAIAEYAGDYPNQLPQAKTPDRCNWYDRLRSRPRRANLFILVKHNYVRNPQTLVCPAQACAPTSKPANIDQLDDFPPTMAVSYSFQNLYGDHRFTAKQRLKRWRHARLMAIMADQTPLLQNGKLRRAFEPLSLSANHRGIAIRGQNVLTLDGSATWKRTPLVGINEDNIWQAGKLSEYSGCEVPMDPTDSFLAP